MKLVLRVGGSVLGSPPSPSLVKQYTGVVRKLRIQNHSLGIIVGGGPFSREYITAGEQIGLNKPQRDWLAILVSRINARIFANVLGGLPDRIPETVNSMVELVRKKGIAVMGGLKPGMTTDTVGSLVAKGLKANLLVKASDQEGIYTSDPKKDPRAKKIDRLNFQQLKELLSGEHEPGIHTILDPVAVDILSRTRIRVIVLNGFKPENIISAVEGEAIGTTIE